MIQKWVRPIKNGVIVRNCENPINVPNKMLKNLTADLISLPPRTNGVEKAMRHVFEVLKGSYHRFLGKNKMKDFQRKRESRVLSLSKVCLVPKGFGACVGLADEPSTARMIACRACF